MRWNSVALAWLGVVCFGGQVNVTAQEANSEDVDALKRQLEAQEASIQELRKRLDEIDLTQPVVPPPGDDTVKEPSGAAPSPAEEAEEKWRQTDDRLSPVKYRDQFNDRQAAAARPEDFVLDPQYRGFTQLGDTVFMLRFNPRPRVDMTLDTQNTGNDYRFVTGQIPTGGDGRDPGRGGGMEFNMNGNGSQLRVDIRAPSMDGDFRVYYQNDFFGSDTKAFQYRLQHFYGQYYGILGGFTYGVFEDPDAWPDTVDYEGPNSVIFARRVVLHYTRSISDNFNLTLGIEDPDIYLDRTYPDPADPTATVDAGELRTRMPDTGFNVRWENADRGHMQFSSLVRTIGIESDVPGVSDDDVFGWGVNLSGSIALTERDRIIFWGVYGQGIGGMGNDTSFVDSDAALDADGDLQALEYVSGLVGYTHHWSERFRSTATYGYVNLGNTGAQLDDAYDKTQYASCNIVYQLYKRLSVGFETLYGYNKQRDGDSGQVVRMQIGIVYSMF